jgi:hypothetical protein
VWVELARSGLALMVRGVGCGWDVGVVGQRAGVPQRIPYQHHALLVWHQAC